MDIDNMLKEAEYGKRGNYVENKITSEAQPFWIALRDRVEKDQVSMKPFVVCRLLEENFNIKISESAMRRYLKELSSEEKI
jgi:transposase